jgi:hypothetical protein
MDFNNGKFKTELSFWFGAKTFWTYIDMENFKNKSPNICWPVPLHLESGIIKDFNKNFKLNPVEQHYSIIEMYDDIAAYIFFTPKVPHLVYRAFAERIDARY